MAAQVTEPMDTTEKKGEEKKNVKEILCKPGRITFSTDDPIGLKHDGSRKPKVYEGLFNGVIKVAVKEYQRAGEDEELKCVKRNLEILSTEKNRHPNLIRYYGEDQDYQQFKYLAIELCECSVAGLITRAEKLRILEHLNHKEILRQSAEAVRFLHGLGMIHRNLHPENFLIAQISDRDYVVKLTDFHCTKDWKVNPNQSGTRASDGWIAPDGAETTKETDGPDHKKRRTEHETATTAKTDGTNFPRPVLPSDHQGGQKVKKKPDEDPRTDVFILGCFFYYVLSGGKHPFGSTLDRIGNINNSEYKVYEQDWDGNNSEGVQWGKSLSGGKNPFGGPEGNKEGYVKEWEFEMDWWKVEAHNALDLIKNSMIKHKKSGRKSMAAILSHPYFDIHTPYKIYDEGGQSMRNKPGLCIIVSQEKFYDEDSDLPGNEPDTGKLKDTFAGFGYDVLVYKNLTAQELRDWITPGKLNDLGNYNSLVVCILSHGDKGNVYGVDGQPVLINQIKYAFNGGSCEALKDKPKVFIILACQGCNNQEAYEKEPDNSKKKKQTVEYQTNPIGGDPPSSSIDHERPVGIQKPPLIHHLSLMSTIEEFVAYSYRKSGSPFIQTLCDQLQSEYGRDERVNKTRDLLQLFHSEVVPRVAGRKFHITGETPENVVYKQTPESRSSLLRTIRFRKVTNYQPTEVKIRYDGSTSESFKKWREHYSKKKRKEKKGYSCVILTSKDPGGFVPP